MRRRDPGVEKRILNLISKKTYGLTIEEVSKQLKINRTTASRYLLVLSAKEKVLVREIGQSKLHYPNTRRIRAWLL